MVQLGNFTIKNVIHLIKFSKRGGAFKWVTSFRGRGPVQFSLKNKLKSEIINDKKSL